MGIILDRTIVTIISLYCIIITSCLHLTNLFILTINDYKIHPEKFHLVSLVTLSVSLLMSTLFSIGSIIAVYLRLNQTLQKIFLTIIFLCYFFSEIIRLYYAITFNIISETSKTLTIINKYLSIITAILGILLSLTLIFSTGSIIILLCMGIMSLLHLINLFISVTDYTHQDYQRQTEKFYLVSMVTLVILLVLTPFSPKIELNPQTTLERIFMSIFLTSYFFLEIVRLYYALSFKIKTSYYEDTEHLLGEQQEIQASKFMIMINKYFSIVTATLGALISLIFLVIFLLILCEVIRGSGGYMIITANLSEFIFLIFLIMFLLILRKVLFL